MKIDLKADGRTTTIDTIQEITLRDVFTGVCIKTDQGLFGVCQRDGGIEVLLDGKIVWSSAESLPEHDTAPQAVPTELIQTTILPPMKGKGNPRSPSPYDASVLRNKVK